MSEIRPEWYIRFFFQLWFSTSYHDYAKNYDIFQMSTIHLITCCKQLNNNNISQQSRNILPGCSCVLQTCDSLLVPLQFSDESPQDEQFLVRDCWPPQAVAEQVPHATQDDHTKYMKEKQHVLEIRPEWYNCHSFYCLSHTTNTHKLWFILNVENWFKSVLQKMNYNNID